MLATHNHHRLTLLLLLQVGFPRRDPDRLRVALDNTHRLIWIRSTKQSRVARLGQLLGFARATSDGVFSATIWCVLTFGQIVVLLAPVCEPSAWCCAWYSCRGVHCSSVLGSSGGPGGAVVQVTDAKSP
jgi:hypothetical protein